MKKLFVIVLLAAAALIGCDKNSNPVTSTGDRSSAVDSVILFSSSDTFAVTKIQVLSENFQKWDLTPMTFTQSDSLKISFDYKVINDSGSYMAGNNIILYNTPYNIFLSGSFTQQDSIPIYRHYYKTFKPDYPCTGELVKLMIVVQYGCEYMEVTNFNLHRKN
jgi:hypothetical protein